MYVSVAPLTFALMLAACASAPAARIQEPVPAEGTMVLAIGAPQRAAGTDLTVTFEAVVADSRCPTGTQCIWAGDAAVRVRLAAPNLSHAIATLHTNLDTAKETTYAGFTISLQAVTPVPSADAPVRAEDYRVTLLIARK
jgi:hypothetical protein